MPAAAPAGPPPSRLVRWCLGLAGLLALALIGVVVNYLAHGGTEELNPVAEAAEKTGTLPGGRLKLEVTYAVAGSSRSVSGTGGGVFDARSSRARVTLTEPGADGSPLRVQSVGDNRKIFIRSRVLAAELPAGKQWLGMEPLLGHDPSAAFGASGGAEGSLDMLKAVGGEVEKVGEETLRGGPTTRYKARLELSKAAQLLSEDGEAALAHEYSQFAEKVPAPIPVEVWIDETGLVRRFRMVEPLPSESGPTVTMDMRMEFFDFAAHPGIAFPPAGQVLDYTPVLRAELGMTNGGNVGSLEPPRALTLSRLPISAAAPTASAGPPWPRVATSSRRDAGSSPNSALSAVRR